MRFVWLLLVSVSFAKAWELPGFLFENMPSIHDASVRVLDATEEPAGKKEGPPTSLPTESPAPSPSPTEIPTAKPTVTAQPTTLTPTESPAPSPSPTEIPTIKPSASPSIAPSAAPTISSQPSAFPSNVPTAIPSASPSASPSMAPSVSMAPSNAPSQSPSEVPSQSPTLSTQPSASPSFAPTTSMQPSSAPTHVRMVDATFQATLDLGTPLNSTQILAFEVATADYIDSNETDVDFVKSGILEDVLVVFKNQSIVDGRRLQGTFVPNVEQKLEVEFSVSAMYIGSDEDFDMHETFDSAFQDENQKWILFLALADPVFQTLFPDFDDLYNETGVASSILSENGSGMSSGTMALVSVIAVVAVTLGVVAAIYSVQVYKKSVYGEELNSPHLSNETFEFDHQQIGARKPGRKSVLLPPSQSEMDVEETSWAGKGRPMSPNSIENGGCMPFDQTIPSFDSSKNDKKARVSFDSNNPWNHIRLKTNESCAKDPPSSRSEADFENDPRNMESLFDNNTEISETSRSLHRESNQEIMLTRSMGGTLGAKAVAGSSAGSAYTASDFSSHAQSFFSGLVGKIGNKVSMQSKDKNAPPESDQPYNMEGATLGARAVQPEEQMQLREQSSYDSMSRRAGLYDVFAPAGPIGIIVDTTKNGPSVHSLKRTSPMLGLINPGDLIVGLDDEDTRGMTAATLTRLMAQKSNQKERKITLLTTE